MVLKLTRWTNKISKLLTPAMLAPVARIQCTFKPIPPALFDIRAHFFSVS